MPIIRPPGGGRTGGTSMATTPGILVQVPPEVRDAGAEPAGWFTPDIVPYLGRNTGFYPRNGASGNDTINLPPIPLEWIVSPQNITRSSNECPTAEGTIRAFVAANLIAALILIVTAFRPFLYRSTLHVFGKRGGRGVYWTWILWFGLHLLGNLGASLVVVNTLGYGHLELARIFALYASKPNLKPWWLAILRTVVVVDAHRFPDGDKRLGRGSGNTVADRRRRLHHRHLGALPQRCRQGLYEAGVEIHVCSAGPNAPRRSGGGAHLATRWGGLGRGREERFGSSDGQGVAEMDANEHETGACRSCGVGVCVFHPCLRCCLGVLDAVFDAPRRIVSRILSVGFFYLPNVQLLMT